MFGSKNGHDIALTVVGPQAWVSHARELIEKNVPSMNSLVRTAK
jgi:hypothetical protein